jgi:2-dehydropantoate 2-reductase
MVMRILIMGAGGVGGYYGARFAEAGHDVTFIARGRHKQAIAENGLEVRSQHGDVTIANAKVLDDPAAAGVADFVLVCTKLRDLEAAALAIRPAVGPETGVISLQNGVEKERVLTASLGRDAVMGGATQIATAIAAPGVIQHTGTMANIFYGERDRSRTGRLTAFDQAARAAPGFEATLAEDIDLEIWKKFSFLAPFAGITAFYRKPIGPLRADPQIRQELEALVGEAVSVGIAEGVAFSPERQSDVMDFVDGVPAVMKPSMLHDLEAGKPLELDWLTGAVCRLGQSHGIATPASQRIYAALASFKHGAGD